MCFPALDNLQLGGFFLRGGGGGKNELPNKREEGPPDHRMGHGLLLFYGPSLRRYFTVSMLWQFTSCQWWFANYITETRPLKNVAREKWGTH